ncbi:hypothetical protein MmiHf6_01700 [Methanimicrococcus hongohii]|uniref:Uncharacterized protein n=1 Tax=Methanimicrococcus hongohii TaxID=3028295 RepID=A0AA96V0S4_9EURY|nr:hypothetical protein [Methanimicrococcus sp. Hf6]WNY22878.1 hypothetical protein MmiHf6_01700 [Methanimicrococcus sp. Hf6]
MGLFGKLFGSNEYNAKEPQGHLKTKNYNRLDWEIDDNEYTKQDYIASSEYIIPSHQTVTEFFGKLDAGEIYAVNDVFFRIDYMGRPKDWYKQRDYMFKEITLKKKEKSEEAEETAKADEKEDNLKENEENIKTDSDTNVYVMEGTGTFLKEDYTGTILESETRDVSIYAEITYKNNRLDVRSCRGFDDTDNWYAFMLLFKILEYYKYPTETCKTVEVGVCEK